MTTLTTVAPTAELVTEWQHGEHVLHQHSANHYSLYGPEHPGDDLPAWLGAFGFGAGWWCNFESAGEVLVTHFYRGAASGISKDLVDFFEPRWT